MHAWLTMKSCFSRHFARPVASDVDLVDIQGDGTWTEYFTFTSHWTDYANPMSGPLQDSGVPHARKKKWFTAY